MQLTYAYVTYMHSARASKVLWSTAWSIVQKGSPKFGKMYNAKAGVMASMDFMLSAHGIGGLHCVMLTLGLDDATMMGPSTIPPVIAKACCSPMIRASKIGRGSFTAKKGGSLSVVSLRQ